MTDPSPTRRRLPADEARRRILAAAEGHLARVGPAGLKLTELAAELGISHPAILHHFGSREGLVREVVRHAVLSLNQQLTERVRVRSGDAAALMDRVADFYGARGHARLMAWLALAGEDGTEGPEQQPLLMLARELQTQLAGDEGDLDEIIFRFQVGALALLGEALLGARIRRASGQVDSPEVRARFRKRLVELLAPAVSP